MQQEEQAKKLDSGIKIVGVEVVADIGFSLDTNNNGKPAVKLVGAAHLDLLEILSEVAAKTSTDKDDKALLVIEPVLRTILAALEKKKEA